MPLARERVQAVRAFRLDSKRAQTKKAAEPPHRFGTEIFSQEKSVIVPRVSSERRRYLPLGLLAPEVFASDAALLIPNADRFHFGVLHSTFHNAWMRSVAGRLKGDFRYSGGVVYNNFIWPNADDTTIARIETCAQAVLDARESYQGATLADMYDPDNDFLYPELMNAHRGTRRRRRTCLWRGFLRFGRCRAGARHRLAPVHPVQRSRQAGVVPLTDERWRPEWRAATPTPRRLPSTASRALRAPHSTR